MKSAFAQILTASLPTLTMKDLLAISPKLCKDMIDYLRTHHIPTITANITTMPYAPESVCIKYFTLLYKVIVILNGSHEELVLLDEELEVVVIHEDILKKCEVPVNLGIHMQMQTANGVTQLMPRCMEMLKIEVAGIRT